RGHMESTCVTETENRYATGHDNKHVPQKEDQSLDGKAMRHRSSACGPTLDSRPDRHSSNGYACYCFRGTWRAGAFSHGSCFLTKRLRASRALLLMTTSIRPTRQSTPGTGCCGRFQKRGLPHHFSERPLPAAKACAICARAFSASWLNWRTVSRV